MLDDEKRAKIDQTREAMMEILPPIWRRLYLKNIEEGFSKLESMDLVKVYILSSCPFGVNGAK